MRRASSSKRCSARPKARRCRRRSDRLTSRRARALAARRRAGEPLQYVLGHWAFRALDLLVDPRVLIPRPETEQVVEVALDELGARGPCPLRPSSMPAPARVPSRSPWPPSWPARIPARRSGPPTPAPRRWPWRAPTWTGCARSAVAPSSRSTFVQGSWLDPLPPRLQGAVDLVVSNPPYVARRRVAATCPARCGASRSARWWRVTAPTARPGSRDVEDVLAEAWTWLARPGAVVIEMAPASGRRRRPAWPGAWGTATSGWRRTWPSARGRWSVAPGDRPQAGGPPPAGRGPGCARRWSGDRGAGRRGLPPGGSPCARRRGRPAVRARARPRRARTRADGRRSSGPGRRAGLGLEQGGGAADRPHVAGTAHRHGAGPARRPGRGARRVHHHAGDARRCAPCVATASRWRCARCAVPMERRSSIPPRSGSASPPPTSR